ncbi:MAG TPA: deoxyribonuclease IV [Candidatus Acidoferrum sp.]|nr:deoxyribonuclease IV [Candidatus Acidoferrum sp.]
MIRIGFHLSVAGGVYNAPLTAEKEGYGTFQIFASNPRAWDHHEIPKEDAERFRQIVKKSNTIPFAHVPYLCNPSSTSRETLEKSMKMLVNNMESCNALGIEGLVMHQGSHLGKGSDHGRKTIIDAVGKALDRVPKVHILLENSAGYTNSMGSKFDEMGYIIDQIGSPRVGVCLDTCHTFAAGYDLRTKESIEKTCAEFEDNIGFKRLGLVHLNDAKFELGSGLDRHWHIGQGNIGAKGFTELFRNKNFKDRCFVMETPINGDGNETTNMRAIKQIIKNAKAD